MSIAYLGIGSNLGDRQKNIDTAIVKLKERKGVEVQQVSSAIETDPVGDPNQPKFLNAVCRINTTLYPDELLSTLKSIENEMGRQASPAPKRVTREEQLAKFEQGNFEVSQNDAGRSEKKEWGPRPIDLDILFYDDIIMKGNNLVIPHQLLHERLFVLCPLAEIAPDFMHPVLKKTVQELLMQFGVKNESS